MTQCDGCGWWCGVVFHTHGKVEAQVSIRGGVQVGSAHPSATLPFENQGSARLKFSTLGPINGSFYVPAGLEIQRFGLVRKISQ